MTRSQYGSHLLTTGYGGDQKGGLAMKMINHKIYNGKCRGVHDTLPLEEI
jgi:hypothetical protein